MLTWQHVNSNREELEEKKVVLVVLTLQFK